MVFEGKILFLSHGLEYSLLRWVKLKVNVTCTMVILLRDEILFQYYSFCEENITLKGYFILRFGLVFKEDSRVAQPSAAYILWCSAKLILHNRLWVAEIMQTSWFQTNAFSISWFFCQCSKWIADTCNSSLSNTVN